MRTKFLMMLCAGSLLVAGCSSTHDLTAAGQSVRFTDTQPGSECLPVLRVTGFPARTAKTAPCVGPRMI